MSAAAPDPDHARAPVTGARPFTLLLRLLPQHGADGHVVGHAEVVATSEVVAIGSGDDLVALVRRLSGDPVAEVSTTAIGEIH